MLLCSSVLHPLFRFGLCSFPRASPFGGDEGNRTPDPLLAGQVLSQLSYTPVGRTKNFFRTSLFLFGSSYPLRAFRSLKTEQQQMFYFDLTDSFWVSPQETDMGRNPGFSLSVLHRKEVIQPHLPIRLPCYDLTPITGPTFGSCLLAVSLLTSGVSDFHGLTGGVYKARERIHRGMLIRDY